MTTESGFNRFWDGLQTRLDQVLAEVIPAGAPVVLLDYPVYGNVGDLLIWLGTEEWLTRTGREVRGRWNRHNFPFHSLPEGTIILCQGGGNLGDLYPQQSFREKVVRRYPDSAVVFLPQTIHFRDETRLAASAGFLNGHGNLTVLVRDHISRALAEERFGRCRIRLAPDMAVWLHPLTRTLGVDAGADRCPDRLWLLRRDEETPTGDQPVPNPGEWVGDWADMLGARALAMRAIKQVSRLVGPVMPAGWFARFWEARARAWTRLCAGRIGGVSHLVTSRLHGHILASLAGTPNTLVDNSYGKNSAYYHAWHRELSLAVLAGEREIRN